MGAIKVKYYLRTNHSGIPYGSRYDCFYYMKRLRQQGKRGVCLRLKEKLLQSGKFKNPMVVGKGSLAATALSSWLIGVFSLRISFSVF